MRFAILVLSAVCLLMGGCLSGSSRDYHPRTVDKLTSGNYSNYSVWLAPGEFRIIAISNHSEPLIDTTGDWWKDAVFYQVYVRSFYDSDGNGTGDLQGLTEKLDYVTNLGCDGIWTLPVFDSLHDGGMGRALGYEARNYYAIDPDYGNFSDWQNYVSNAHGHGIKVIMDMVINHTSKDNPWFVQSAKKDPKYRNWYIWTNATMDELEKAGWKQPWGGGHAYDQWHVQPGNTEMFYATWGAELNFKNPEVREEGKRIAGYWLTNGADGFRLDAIRYLIEDGPGALQADSPSTLQYIREYVAGIKGAKTNAFTVGEIWSSDQDVAKYYQDGFGLDCGFSFRYQGNVADAISGGLAGAIGGYVKDRATKMTNIPKLFFAPFGDNHDMKRSMTKWRDQWDKSKLSAAVLLTQPGTPFIYYGNEVGMIGQQTPMQWSSNKNAGFTTNAKPWTMLAPYTGIRNVEAQMADPDSLWNLYKSLIAFRKSEPAMRRGDIRSVKSGNRSVFSYLRTGPGASYLIVGNVSEETTEAKIDFSGSRIDSATEHTMTLIPFSKENQED